MKRLTVITALIFCFCVSPTRTHAQVQDSFITLNKRHLKANVSSLTFSVLLNRTNRYFLASGRDWADINFDRWKQNLQQWPEWDWDLYTTNWYAHPFQGAIYYNTSRSLKLGYGESIGYALLGTSLWEYLGEDLPPSYNDFYTTFLGGIYMGEVLYRLSENILDDRVYGKKRLSKELLAALVNPGGGLSRLMYGEIKDHHSITNHLRVPMQSKLSVSSIYMLSSSKESIQTLIPNLEYSVDYGLIDKGKINYSPFEMFWLRSWLRFDKVDQDRNEVQVPIPFFNIKSTAVIHGRNIFSNDTGFYLMALFQDYDYYKTFSFEFAAISFSVGFLQVLKYNKAGIQNRIQFGGIALSAISSDAVDLIRPDDQGDERDYTMGHGYMFKYNGLLDLNGVGRLSIAYDYWNTFIGSGLNGTESNYQIEFKYEYPITSSFSVASSFLRYSRRGEYQYDSTDYKYADHNSEVEIHVIYSF